MIEKKFLKFTAAAMIIFALLMSGCGEETGVVTLPPDFQRPPETLPEKTFIDVYWDATYSMKGYTTLAAGNVYRTLPDLLGDIGSSMGEVKFYRFGENIQPLEGREYRKFSSPEPYNELITAVHNVIEKADTSHLSIIITDLFESDSDWSNVTQKLRDKYFSKHLAVAVIGMKNSFNGEIFDVGLNAAKFNYNSYDYPERFRPFYLIVMGSEVSINEFMDKFRERQTMPNETNYLLLSENLTESTDDFSRLQVHDLENFFSDDRLNISDKRVKEFGLDTFNKDAKFEVDFDYKQPLGACPLDMTALAQNVRVLYLSEQEWLVKDENDLKIELEQIEGAADSYAAEIKLNPEKTFVRGYVNFVQASLSPTAKGYKLPDWVKAWNMANVDVEPQNFDGSKTVNLIHVLGSLKDSVFAAAHPSLLNINFIVDCR